ncbi:MAG: hypothetical protein WBS24_07475 [Terriglobales bacterium]
MSVGCMAQSWDVAASFEDGWTTKSNPYGMWSYGYSSGFTAPVTLYDRAEQNGVNGPNTQFWLSSAVDLANSPSAAYNNGPDFDEGSTHLSAKEFALVTGDGGQYSDVVFTAPIDGNYFLQGSFRGSQDDIGVVVGVAAKGKVIFHSSIASKNQVVPFQKTIPLKAGQAIVFSVGPGSARSGGLQNTCLSAGFRLAP